MTPKTKAKKLVDKFEFMYVSPMYLSSAKEHSKQCALIAVDEMINMCKIYHNHNIVIFNRIFTQLSVKYWQEVKQEIEKL